MSSPAGSNVVKLQGSIKYQSATSESSFITAVVNMKIPQYSFSGTVIEKVSCYTASGTKDDPSVFKGVKTTAYVKNVEYRLTAV